MKEKFKILVFLLLFGSQMVFGQSKTITGTVTDNEGQTLPGATVVLVGTTQGTVTDLDGKYSMNAETGNQLQFSFIGFQDQIISVENETVIDVQMKTDSEALEEVVIVGYGTQKKETVVGAITQTTSEELKKQGHVTNITDALAGAMPGVTVLPSTGLPGGGGLGGNEDVYKESDILIRGKATWNDASPLILVDGIERDMNDIDINEVESVSVLKDASATAVFGMKGGNGVILITTKRGVVGKPKLTFEANQTFENISKYPEMADTYSSIVSRNRAVLNEVAVWPDSWRYFEPDEILQHYIDKDMPYAFPDNDWRDIMLKDFASSQRFNMNVSGGTKFVKYFGSLSYNHTGDIIKTEDVGQGYNPEYSYDRFNFRTNLDFSLTKTTQFTINLSGLYGIQQRAGAGVWNVYQGIYSHTPNWPVIQYEDGVYGFPQELYGAVGENEYANVNFSGTKVDNRTEVNSDFALKQDLDFITKGLKFKSKLAYDNNFSTSGPGVSDDGVLQKAISEEFYLNGGQYNTETGQYEMNGVPVDMEAEGYAVYDYPVGGTDGFEWVESPLGYSNEKSSGSRTNLYFEASLSYARKFGSHSVSGLALFSRQKTEVGDGWPQKREDWVGRVTYDFNARYLVEVNGAYNGSEQFGPGYKFDFFPSLAVGWNIANELFMENNLSFINLLKVKYSDGMVGNDRVRAGQWGYLTVWESGSPFGGDNDHGRFGYSRADTYLKYQEGTPGNPNLRWEKSHKQNLGLEFGIYDNLFSGSVDFFKEYRDDMLVAADDRTIPHIYGQTAPAANIGEVKSNGFEIEASVAKNFENGLYINVGGSWTYARNEVIVKEDPEFMPFYQKEEGYAIGQVRSTQQTGFIQSWDDVYNGVNNVSDNRFVLPGDFRFMDYNANGVIDPDDSAPYGYPVYPRNTYTANLNVDYKNWSLSALFYGTKNTTRTVSYNLYGSESVLMYPDILENTWTPEYGNANPTFPQLAFQKGNSGTGTYYKYDGALLRIKSVELSYTLPGKWANAIRASKVRLYANGNNLFVWTKMPADGEGRNFATRNYPVKKNVTLGLNVQF